MQPKDLHRTQRELDRLARARVRDPETTRDLVQETWAAALRREESAPSLGWMRQALSFLALNHRQLAPAPKQVTLKLGPSAS